MVRDGGDSPKRGLRLLEAIPNGARREGAACAGLSEVRLQPCWKNWVLAQALRTLARGYTK